MERRDVCTRIVNFLVTASLLMVSRCVGDPQSPIDDSGPVGCWQSATLKEPETCKQTQQLQEGAFFWSIESTGASLIFRRNDGTFCGARFERWWLGDGLIHFLRNPADGVSELLEYPIEVDSRSLKVNIEGEWVLFARTR